MKRILITVMIALAGLYLLSVCGCELEKAQEFIQDVNAQITDPNSALQQTAEIAGQTAEQVKIVITLFPAIPGKVVIGGIATLVILAAGLIKSLRKKQAVTTTLKAVVQAIENEKGCLVQVPDYTKPLSSKGNTAPLKEITIGEILKPVIARQMRQKSIYAEGKQLVDKAKNVT